MNRSELVREIEKIAITAYQSDQPAIASVLYFLSTAIIADQDQTLAKMVQSADKNVLSGQRWTVELANKILTAENRKDWRMPQ